MGIQVLPPHVNKSNRDFAIEIVDPSSKKQVYGIRFGLNAIKHVGSAAIDALLATRENIGTFSSLTQLIAETDGRKINKTTLECLIKVGALDDFGTRASMLENLEEIRKRVSAQSGANQSQDSLFSSIEGASLSMQDAFVQIPEYPQAELLSFEKELLGLYLTDHPMAKALTAVERQANKKISEIDASIHQDQRFRFGGVITKIRIVQTKKSGKEMAFGQIEDRSGQIRFVVFPQTYETVRSMLTQDSVVLMLAKVDSREEETQLIVESISVPAQHEITQSEEESHHQLYIPRKTTKDTLEALGKLLKQHPGKEKVQIVIPNGAKPQTMLLPYGVSWSEDLKKQAEELLA